jgi:hypothetical protein
MSAVLSFSIGRVFYELVEFFLRLQGFWCIVSCVRVVAEFCSCYCVLLALFCSGWYSGEAQKFCGA